MHHRHLLCRLSRLAMLAGALSLGACAEGTLPDEPDDTDDGDGEIVEPPADEDLGALLARPVVLDVADAASGSQVRVEAITLRDGSLTSVDLAVRGGSLMVSVDPRGRLMFEELTVTGDDYQVSPAVVPPAGLMLTDLSFVLSQPTSALPVSASDDAMTATVDLAIDVQWSVALDHGVVELAPIRLGEMPFDVALTMDDDGLVTASLTAARSGTFWTWAGLFELRDLEIELVATAALDR